MIPLSYNARSLMVRKRTSAAAASGIALVVFVFSSVLMLSKGIEEALGNSGSHEIAIVLRDGSDAELASSIELPAIGLVTAAPEVARRGGQPDAIAEVVGVLAMDKVGGAGMSNVAIRGVPDDVYQFRPSVRIVEGRAATPGSDEAVVGAAIRGRFKGVDLGQSFEIRKNRMVKIVGVFEDNESSFESEIWGGLETVRTAFGREGLVSSIRVRLQSAGALDAFKTAIESDRRLGLDVKSEAGYFEAQSDGVSMFVSGIGFIIAAFVSVAAMIGAMITMYAAVSNRSREIGTLRALGFSKFSILTSFLFEAVLLALAGGAMGAFASIGMIFVRFNIVNFASWSEMIFRFTPTPGIVLSSVAFAAVLGVIGGLFPAIRAARLNVLEALRE